MNLTRQEMNHYFTVCICLTLLATVCLPSIRAAALLSPEEGLPINIVPSQKRRLEDQLHSPTHYGLRDTPSLQNYFVKFFSPLTSSVPAFLSFPDTPCLFDVHAKQTAKAGTATRDNSAPLLGRPHDSEHRVKQVTEEGSNSVSDPLRAFPSSKVIANSLWPGPPLSTPLGFSKTDELLASFLFHLWAALHPQDAAYYISLSQKAPSPALTPMTGLRDTLNVDTFDPESPPSQGFPPMDLFETILQDLLHSTTNGANTRHATVTRKNGGRV